MRGMSLSNNSNKIQPITQQSIVDKSLANTESETFKKDSTSPSHRESEDNSTDNMAHSLKDVFVKFAENTTAHAPPKVVTHKNILSKIFWFLMFFTGIAVFLYFSTELVNSYREFATTTDIKLRFDILEFPAVTICNQNQFRMDRVPQELKTLMDNYLQSKRGDMFGGKDKFMNFQMGPGAGPANGPGVLRRIQKQEGGVAQATTQSNGPATTVAGNQPQATVANNVQPQATTANNVQTQATAANNVQPQATTANNNQQPPPQKRRRRRKRAVATLSDEELQVMDDMRGFYVEPDNEKEVQNMTWFANVGETSADLDIFLNMTSYLADEYSIQELMKMGHSIEEMLQECTFLGRICGPEDFYMFYDNKYGNCYTFNSGLDGSFTKISNPGASSGLDMTYFINQAKYVPVLSPQAGVRVLLHRQGQVPLMEEDGFDVSTGAKTGIAVRYVEITRKGPPYGTCESTRLKNNTLYPGNYTQKGCIKQCIQTLVVKECGCAHPSYRKPEKISVCTPDDYACVDEQEYYILESGTCSSECPVPCWESQFQYTLSSSRWPAGKYQEYFLESMLQRGEDFVSLLTISPNDALASNFLKLNIYYDNLNYYKYDERPTMKFEDLIGALGGHLGLWIGMSLVSFFEIFEMIISMFKYCCCRKSGKTSSSSTLDREREETTKTPVKSFSADVWVNDK